MCFRSPARNGCATWRRTSRRRRSCFRRTISLLSTSCRGRAPLDTERYPHAMDVAGFIAVATLVVVTPGPDMTLVARNTFASGRLSGLATSAGTCSGLLVHATAAALGLSAVLLASSQAFTVVKVAGAAYLIFLGIRTILGARRETSFRDGAKVDPWAAYRQGILTNVLNPKVAIFFLSLLPQFVEPGPGF